MGCPCENPVTGEIEIVNSKTKEMVYRMQSPNLKKIIENYNDEGIKQPTRHNSQGGNG